MQRLCADVVSFEVTFFFLSLRTNVTKHLQKVLLSKKNQSASSISNSTQNIWWKKETFKKLIKFQSSNFTK